MGLSHGLGSGHERRVAAEETEAPQEVPTDGISASLSPGPPQMVKGFYVCPWYKGLPPIPAQRTPTGALCIRAVR